MYISRKLSNKKFKNPGHASEYLLIVLGRQRQVDLWSLRLVWFTEYVPGHIEKPHLYGSKDKVLGTNSDDWSQIPRTHMVEGENQFSKVVL